MTTAVGLVVAVPFGLGAALDGEVDERPHLWLPGVRLVLHVDDQGPGQRAVLTRLRGLRGGSDAAVTGVDL